jgi:hypothetical protein
MTHGVASEPLIYDIMGRSVRHYWFSADPLPLSDMLASESVRDAVTAYHAVTSGLAPRFRIAARWFSQAFWSLEQEDAALSLGIALDALIGSKSGLPGRAMRERFALLEPSPSHRQAKADRYDNIFAIRSTLAHGGQSSRLGKGGEEIRRIEGDITWAAQRMRAIEQQFALTGERDLDEWFEGMRWGTING